MEDMTTQLADEEIVAIAGDYVLIPRIRDIIAAHEAKQAQGLEFEVSALTDLIEQYGDERATAAYHGKWHCRTEPEELLARIKAALPIYTRPQQGEDARDAERYRWLTKHAYIGDCYTEDGVIKQVCNTDREVPAGEWSSLNKGSVGEAIDAAIAAQKGGAA